MGVYRRLSRRNVVPKLPSPAHTPGDSLHPHISKDTKGLFSEHVCETRETETEIILVYLGIKDYISICSPLLLSQSKKTLQGTILRCKIRLQMRPLLPTAKTADRSVYSHCSEADYLIKLAALTLSHSPHARTTSNTFLTANR